MRALKEISSFVLLVCCGLTSHLTAQNQSSCCKSLDQSACVQAVPVYADVNQPIEARVEDALARMTLEEKVALCHAQSKFSSAGVPRLGIPEIWHSDGPHGVRDEIEWDTWNSAGWTNDSCTAFPALTCLAATFNPRMSFIYGMALGEEARYRNKTIML